MVSWVDRKYPDGKDGKSNYTTQDDYELVYLRHRYLHRSPNPSGERLSKFLGTVNTVMKKVTQQFEYVFGVNGQDEDDIRNVAMVHIVNYLGEFGLREHPDKLEKEVERMTKAKERSFKRRKMKYISDEGYRALDLSERLRHYRDRDLIVTDEEIDSKDIRNCTSFLYQRLEEWGKVASIKNKNIRGTYSITRYLKKFGKRADVEDHLLLERAEDFGYAQVTKREFQEGIKKTKSRKKSTEFDLGGYSYRKVYISPKELTKEDLEQSYYGENRGEFYDSPLNNLLKGQDSGENLLTNLLSEPGKLRMLKKFARDNKNRPNKQDEVRQAVEIIKEYEPGFEFDFSMPEYGTGAYCVWPRR